VATGVAGDSRVEGESMSIEAMKLALEALEKNYVLINGTERFLGLDQIKDTYYAGCFDVDGINKQTNEAITALRTAIEQAEKQEPVECMCGICKLGKREWVGLTDEEIFKVENAVPDEVIGDSNWCVYFAKAIEAKLKEKNT
jgi:hypothetical protein